MKKKFLLQIVLVSLLASASPGVYAQQSTKGRTEATATETITGVVIDKNTREPLKQTD